jgi:hypothetical protein
MASASRLGQRVAPGASLVGALVGDLGRPSSALGTAKDDIRPGDERKLQRDTRSLAVVDRRRARATQWVALPGAGSLGWGSRRVTVTFIHS